MALVSFTVTRNVDARKETGGTCKVALVSIVHENGVGQTHCIPEDKIRFFGEHIIEEEAREVARR